MTTSPVILPGKSHDQRNLAGYSSWGHEESDVTERLSAHIFSQYLPCYKQLFYVDHISKDYFWYFLFKRCTSVSGAPPNYRVESNESSNLPFS